MSYGSCAHCGRRFEIYGYNSCDGMEFCSDSCMQAYINKKKQAESQAKAARKQAEAAREQAEAEREKADAINRANQIEQEKLAYEKSKIPCTWCGTKFIPSEGCLRGTQIFCSRKCAQEFFATPEGQSALQKQISSDELYDLGNNYYNGKNGMPQNYYMAALYFNAAAEQGNANAIYSLGRLYGNGQGVPRDEKRAFKLYTKAAELGNEVVIYEVGRLFGIGNGGMSKDPWEALKWYTKAAEMGYAKAIGKVGLYHEKGLGGLTADKAKAIEWYTKAAELGDTDAQNALERIREKELEEEKAEERKERIAQQREKEREESLVKGKSILACVFHWLIFIGLAGDIVNYTNEEGTGFLRPPLVPLAAMVVGMVFVGCFLFSMTRTAKEKTYKRMFSWMHFVIWLILMSIVYGGIHCFLG